MDKNTTQKTVQNLQRSEAECSGYWIDYANNLNYVHRWVIQKIELPSSVKMKVVSFLKSDPVLEKSYRPVIEALEMNNPKIIEDLMNQARSQNGD